MASQAPKPTQKFRPVPYGSVLDESLTATRNPGLTVAQNVVYRPFGSVGKRTGSAPYSGQLTQMGVFPVLSGVRWYRGSPSVLKQMLAQCNNQLFVGNDSSGYWAPLTPTLGLGSTPAFYAQSYDPAESAVAGTPASDILIIAYGSGAPLKYDGNVLTPLSPTINNFFTGCENWHDHVWFWGDQNNPDTVFATDLANPEGFTFTLAQTPPGYIIGRGDGDATVQRCIGLGPILAVFKTRSISYFTGYDFYQGEYQFAVNPWITDKGTPSPHSVAVLNGRLFWWDGADFCMMAIGDVEPTPIGLPIVRTAAIAAANSQSAIRAVAGNFLVQTATGPIAYTNVYLCAVDGGSGYADTILMYDDNASQYAGKPAWSVFKGLDIGCFIPWGGPGDQQLLYFGDAVNGSVRLFGGNAYCDVNLGENEIVVDVVTGQIDCGSPDNIKLLRKIWCELDANATTLAIEATSDSGATATVTQTTTSPGAGAILGQAVLGSAILGPSGGKIYQSQKADVTPELRGKNFTIAINEASLTSSYELIGLTFDITEEPYVQ